MTSTKVNLALVGGFVLAMLLSLVVALAILAGRTGATDSYYTVYSNVAGLKFGSQVMYEGYPVGQVEGIEPLQEGGQTQFRVDLTVSHGWKIPRDSVARPVSPGVLSPQTIAITGGNSSEMLKPGEMIPPAMATDLFSAISGAAGNFDEITDTGLLPLLQNLNRQVTVLGDVIEKDVKPMMHDAHAIVGATAEHWPAIVRQADTVTANLALSSSRLNALLSDDRLQAIDRMIVNIDSTAERLRSASGEFDTLLKTGGDDILVALQELRYTMETVSRYAEPVGQNLESSTRNATEFSRLIRQNPGLLLRAPDVPDDTTPPLRRKEK